MRIAKHPPDESKMQYTGRKQRFFAGNGENNEFKGTKFFDIKGFYAGGNYISGGFGSKAEGEKEKGGIGKPLCGQECRPDI